MERGRQEFVSAAGPDDGLRTSFFKHSVAWFCRTGIHSGFERPVGWKAVQFEGHNHTDSVGFGGRAIGSELVEGVGLAVSENFITFFSLAQGFLKSLSQWLALDSLSFTVWRFVGEATAI